MSDRNIIDWSFSKGSNVDDNAMYKAKSKIKDDK